MFWKAIRMAMLAGPLAVAAGVKPEESNMLPHHLRGVEHNGSNFELRPGGQRKLQATEVNAFIGDKCININAAFAAGPSTGTLSGVCTPCPVDYVTVDWNDWSTFSGWTGSFQDADTTDISVLNGICIGNSPAPNGKTNMLGFLYGSTYTSLYFGVSRESGSGQAELWSIFTKQERVDATTADCPGPLGEAKWNIKTGDFIIRFFFASSSAAPNVITHLSTTDKGAPMNAAEIETSVANLAGWDTSSGCSVCNEAEIPIPNPVAPDFAHATFKGKVPKFTFCEAEIAIEDLFPDGLCGDTTVYGSGIAKTSDQGTWKELVGQRFFDFGTLTVLQGASSPTCESATFTVDPSTDATDCAWFLYDSLGNVVQRLPDTGLTPCTSIGSFTPTPPADVNYDAVYTISLYGEDPVTGCSDEAESSDFQFPRPLSVTASGECSEGVNQGKINLSASSTSHYPPVAYSWTLVGSDPLITASGQQVSNQVQGTWRVTATDQLCEDEDTVVLINCCELAATCIPKDEVLEGCGAGDFPNVENVLGNVWTVTGTPCGTPTLLFKEAIDSGNVCEEGGLVRTFVYEIFDDLGSPPSGIFDDGVEFKIPTTCEHIYHVKDTTPPTLSNVQANRDDVECPDCATAGDPFTYCFVDPNYNDNCPGSQLTSATNKVTDCGPIAGTYTKTWTVTDQCGKTAQASAYVEIVDTLPPNLVCPDPNMGLDCTNLGTVPDIANAIDACQGPVTPTYLGCCFDGAAGVDLSLDRQWSATDDCNVSSGCTQENPLSPACPPVI